MRYYIYIQREREGERGEGGVQRQDILVDNIVLVLFIIEMHDMTIVTFNL
jgi:hypothetical protein